MRRTDREVRDISDILAIVEGARVLRLGLYDGEYPYIVPLHYGYEYADGTLTFYMHSAREGRKLDLIRRDGRAFIELDSDEALISGGDAACAYGASFASVMGRGEAVLVADADEAVRGLKLLMKHQTGRDFDMTPAMASAVQVIRVRLLDFTAKARRTPKGE